MRQDARPWQRWAASPPARWRSLPHAADRILLAVFDTQQVEDVIEGPGGLLAGSRRASPSDLCQPQHLRPGAHPDARRARQRRAARRLLECPLSGTSDQVARGEASASSRATRRASTISRDILAAICKRHYFRRRARQRQQDKARHQPHPRPEPRGAGGGPRLRRAARPAARTPSLRWRAAPPPIRRSWT